MVNVVVFLEGALRLLDQLGYAGLEVVAHPGLLLITRVEILPQTMLHFQQFKFTKNIYTILMIKSQDMYAI
jgi:hypothetical protein